MPFSLSSLFPSLLFIIILFFIHPSDADVICHKLPSGGDLTCSRACCRSHEGENQGFFCCDPSNPNAVDPAAHTADHIRPAARAERYSNVYAPGGGFQIDWSLFILGLIISIILSILLSFLCCLLCNGCWLHRRRNPAMYENVGRVGDDGFYHICCGFGIPTGTVVFSTHPPQYAEGAYGPGGGASSLSSARGGRNAAERVHFNDDDGRPRGVLKNGHEMSNGGGGGYHHH